MEGESTRKFLHGPSTTTECMFRGLTRHKDIFNENNALHFRIRPDVSPVVFIDLRG